MGEILLEPEKRLLLERKLEESKAKAVRQKENNERNRIAENINDFYVKYRFADETESESIDEFIGHLDLSFPARISVSYAAATAPHTNMYLCFLCGSKELLKTYVYGSYNDLMNDIEDWDFFSPYLLLIDEDLSHFIYINDNGDMIGSSLF